MFRSTPPTTKTNKAAKASVGAGRGKRVAALLGVVVALSMLDLGLTLGFMMTVGMVESNPLARMLVRHGPMALVAFKFASILMSCGTLWVLRSKASAEMGAWLCVVVMAVLSLHWGNVVRFAASDENYSESMSALSDDPEVVKIVSSPTTTTTVTLAFGR